MNWDDVRFLNLATRPLAEFYFTQYKLYTYSISWTCRGTFKTFSVEDANLNAYSQGQSPILENSRINCIGCSHIHDIDTWYIGKANLGCLAFCTFSHGTEIVHVHAFSVYRKFIRNVGPTWNGHVRFIPASRGKHAGPTWDGHVQCISASRGKHFLITSCTFPISIHLKESFFLLFYVSAWCPLFVFMHFWVYGWLILRLFVYTFVY